MTNRDSDKIVLRVPDGMRDRIKAAAAESGRSMNAEIVATLQEKYPVRNEQRLRELISRMVQSSDSIDHNIVLASLESFIRNNEISANLEEDENSFNISWKKPNGKNFYVNIAKFAKEE